MPRANILDQFQLQTLVICTSRSWRFVGLYPCPYVSSLQFQPPDRPCSHDGDGDPWPGRFKTQIRTKPKHCRVQKFGNWWNMAKQPSLKLKTPKTTTGLLSLFLDPTVKSRKRAGSKWQSQLNGGGSANDKEVWGVPAITKSIFTCLGSPLIDQLRFHPGQTRVQITIKAHHSVIVTALTTRISRLLICWRTVSMSSHGFKKPYSNNQRSTGISVLNGPLVNNQWKILWEIAPGIESSQSHAWPNG